jgi:PAS domain S-box-containing protein
MEKHCRVLITDDDASFRSLLKRQVERMGYVCDEAEDAEKGMELLQASSYDVALIDMMMPGMNGTQMLERMRDAACQTVPIVLTSSGEITTVVEVMRLGAFDFLQKPVDRQVLADAIERALRHGRLSAHAMNMERTLELWQTTFDAVPDLIVVLNQAGGIVRANRAFQEWIGKSEERLHQAPLLEEAAKHPEAAKAAPEAPAAGGLEAAHAFERLFPERFKVSAAPLADKENTVIGSVLVFHDVSEQRMASRKMEQAHHEAERLLANMSAFLVEVGGDHTIRRWNAAAEATFGCAASEVLGKPFRECGIQWDWPAIEQDLPSWMHARESLALDDLQYVRANGSAGMAACMINPLRNENDESAGFILVGIDITERKNLEANLVHAQKMESIGQLAAGIAHEINTPTQYVGDNLNFLQEAFSDLSEVTQRLLALRKAVDGLAETEELCSEIDALLEEADVDYLNEEVPEAIEQSLEGVKRVASIVRAMKEFSHPGSAQKTPVNLNSALESTVTVARNEWKYVADVDFDLTPDLPDVACLPDEINQVFLNILVNASQAIGEVVGQSGEKGRIHVETRCDNGSAVVRISDTGAGIPKDCQKRIFDPFFTTKPVGKGTGQGLAIAHSVIVDKHEGSLTFDSAPGEGTTFIIKIPLKPPKRKRGDGHE